MEHDLQVACVNWFRLQFPRCLIWATPNGGLRAKKTASLLKAEGVVAGVPDIQIPEPRGEFHGLFVEMKYGRNKATDEQNSMMARLTANGYKCAVCYSKEQFITAVCSYMGVPVPKGFETERNELKAFLKQI